MKPKSSYRGNIDKDHLKKWRRKHGWTQKHAAEILKIPLDTYKAYEYGKNLIPGIVEIAISGIDKA